MNEVLGISYGYVFMSSMFHLTGCFISISFYDYLLLQSEGS
jgi:hypothetical protein